MTSTEEELARGIVAGSWPLQMLAVREAQAGWTDAPHHWAAADLDCFVQDESGYIAAMRCAREVWRSLGARRQGVWVRFGNRMDNQYMRARKAGWTRQQFLRFCNDNYLCGEDHRRGAALVRALQETLPAIINTPRSLRITRSDNVMFQACGSEDIIRINIVMIAPLATTERVASFTSAEVRASFDMQQCAVGMTVDADLKPSYQYTDSTLRCVRQGAIAFTEHFGDYSSRRKSLYRVAKYVQRGFKIKLLTPD